MYVFLQLVVSPIGLQFFYFTHIHKICYEFCNQDFSALALSDTQCSVNKKPVKVMKTVPDLRATMGRQSKNLPPFLSVLQIYVLDLRVGHEAEIASVLFLVVRRS